VHRSEAKLMNKYRRLVDLQNAYVTKRLDRCASYRLAPCPTRLGSLSRVCGSCSELPAPLADTRRTPLRSSASATGAPGTGGANMPGDRAEPK